MSNNIIEIDVETKGLQWYREEHRVFLVEFLMPDPDPEEFDSPEDYEPAKPILLRHPEDREDIQALLLQEDFHYRAHNAKFDLHHLDAAGYTLPPQDMWEDSMLLCHILDERQSVALQAVGDRMFGEDAEGETEKAVKRWLKEETKRRRATSKETGEAFVRPDYSDVPDEIMHPYAAHDVRLQRAICDVLEPRLGEDLRGVYDLERALLPALYDMEKLGMLVDVEGAEAFERELEVRLDELEAKCKELAGDPEFNPGSGQQLGKALEARGADLSKARKLKNGLPATDAETLEKIDDDLARTVEDFRGVTKLYSTNVFAFLHEKEDSFGVRYPFIAPDGRIHADTRQVGAHTGRMSTSPNVQNWQRDDLRLRHLVKAAPGNKLVAVDLDSIELRLLAAFVGEGALLTMMKDPEADLHTYTAEMIGLKDYDRGEAGVEPARQRGKKFNYLTIYGGGVRAVMKWFFVDQNTARDYLRRYHDTFPEVGEFQRQIEFALADQGYIRSPWGRHHRAREPRHADREAYKFVSAMVQGTAADLFKDSVVRVHKAGIPMIALTHDEILAEVKEDKAAWAAGVIEEALTDHPRITKIIPLGAEAKIVDRWSHAKDEDYQAPWEELI